MSTAVCPVSHEGWLTQEFLVDPYGRLAQLRGESPVFFDEELDHYIVTRYADIEACLMDRATFLAKNASAPVWTPNEGAQAILAAQGYRRVPTLNNADPPRHAPMRRAVFANLSRPRLAALEPALRAKALDLVTALVAKPVSDLVTDLTYPLPGFAGLGLLGIPAEDFDLLKDWSDGRALFTYGHLSAEDQVRVAHNVGAFWNYVEAFVARKQAEPGDDATSDLLRYQQEHAEEVTVDDVINIVYSLTLAAHESTTNAMGSMLRHLLTQRDQWERLLDDRSLIPNAVDEAMRFDGPIMGHRRVAAVATEVGGVPIPEGARIVLLFASAGRDPEHFPDPDRIDVSRANAEEHLSFGKGPHFCLGAPLARMEMRLALELLLDLAPDMTLLAGQEFPYAENALWRSINQLLVVPS